MEKLRRIFGGDRLLIGALILSAYCYVHQRQYRIAMAASRLDLLRAIDSQKTLAIDTEYTNTADVAVSRGHYYSDKAPGVVFVALPGFFVASEVLSGGGVPRDSPVAWLFTSWVSVACSIGMITAIGGVCLFQWLTGFVSRRCSLVSAFVFAFGTTAFPYATILMSQAAVMGLVAVALWCLRLGHSPCGIAPILRRRELIAGFACGLAIACEYDAALAAGGILAYVFWSESRRGWVLICGAIPPLLLIPAYNWACMGSPFSLPYGHEMIFTQMHSGFYGIHLPILDNAAELLFSPARGLFFWTPYLVLVFAGYPGLYAKSSRLFWLCYLVPVIHIAIISGYFLIAGGSTLGARFLAPIVPLLMLPAGMGMAKLPRTALLLAVVSIMMMGGATIIDFQIPGNAENPLYTFYFPKLTKGEFIYSLGGVLGLKGFWAMLPLICLVGGGFWWLWNRMSDSKLEKSAGPNVE